ncbi:YbjQ family protein [bacterium]|nr:YbjQ family protein [candidate division CSSED10-310 bacterium]
MIITTSDEIPGYTITKCIGLVRGNAVRARNICHDILASLRNLVGGEISDYTKMLAETREQALDRMCEEAMNQGANAVVALRFASSEIMRGAAELLAYGTAVVALKNNDD